MVDPIMHNIKILSYTINWNSIILASSTKEEQTKYINNIAKIISKSGLKYISESDSEKETYIYNFVSLQEIKIEQWELLKNEINKLEPSFLENYNIFVSENNSIGLVTLVNKHTYKIIYSSTNESIWGKTKNESNSKILTTEYLPYHFIIINDNSNYSNNNNIIYINICLPADKSLHPNAIDTLKNKLNLLEKDVVKLYRVILTGQFNTENPHLIDQFDKLLDNFVNNSFDKYPHAYNHVFDNYNKILKSQMPDNLQIPDDLEESTIRKLLNSNNLPLFVILQTVYQIDMDFAKVENKYKKIVNVDFVISHISIIETNVREFKDELALFKQTYSIIPQNIKIRYDKIEKTINDGLLNQQNLQLFNEIYIFNNPIKTYNISIFDSLISELVVFGSKSSASDSLVFRAKYNGNPCFIKMFSLDNSPFRKENSGLEYEQKIYKYLMERNHILKPYFQDYFVDVYDIFKINFIDFFNMMDNLNIKISGGNNDGKIYYSKTNLNALNKILPSIFSGRDRMLYFTITEDIKGETYHDFLIKNITNEDIVIDTLFEILYATYLFNIRLGVFHNDNHFGNILIKPYNIKREYIINKTSLIRNSNFRVCLYDFDLSYMFDNNNNILEQPSNQSIGRINSINYGKDIWTIINSIGYMFNYDTSRVTFELDLWYKNMQNNFFGKKIHKEIYYKTYIYDLIQNVFLQTNEQRENLYQNHMAITQFGKYWNSFCKLPVSSICIQPTYPELYPEILLKRYIKFYKNKLLFIDANAYYKKYLKYKQKYIQLKHKLIL